MTAVVTTSAETPAKNRSLTPKQQQLVLEQRDFGMRLAWSLLSRWNIQLLRSEVQSLVCVALCEAALRFNPHRGVHFGTFLFNYIRGVLLKHFTASVTDARCTVITSLSTDEHEQAMGERTELAPSTPLETLEEREEHSLIQEAIGALDPLEQEVVRRCFIDGKSIVDVARELGYSRGHLSRLKRGAITRMRHRLATRGWEVPARQIRGNEQSYDHEIKKAA